MPCPQTHSLPHLLLGSCVKSATQRLLQKPICERKLQSVRLCENDRLSFEALVSMSGLHDEELYPVLSRGPWNTLQCVIHSLLQCLSTKVYTSLQIDRRDFMGRNLAYEKSANALPHELYLRSVIVWSIFVQYLKYPSFEKCWNILLKWNPKKVRVCKIKDHRNSFPKPQFLKFFLSALCYVSHIIN